MRITGATLSDPVVWFVGAAAGITPALPGRGEIAYSDSASGPLLVLLSTAAMLLGSFLLGLVRRRVLDVLATWAEAGRASATSGHAATAQRAGD